MTESPSKPQRETLEETARHTSSLRQERMPRERKMAQERAFVEDIHEVRYAERRFLPGQERALDEVRAAVDALQPARRPLPEPAPLPVLEAPPPPVDEAKRAALQPLLPGPLVRIETRLRTAQGEVVEAHYREGEGTRSAIFVIHEGKARPFEDLEARVDALPEPARAAPAPPAPVEETPAPAPDPVAAAEPAAKGLGRFRLGKGKPDEAPPEPPAEPPAEEKKGGFASRLKLGRKGKEAPAAEPPAEAPPAEEKASKRRFGFGRK